MIKVSFYLLDPHAKTQSMLYTSISGYGQRLRFATNHSFITKYCHVREKKGTKELLRRNTTLFLEYSEILRTTRDELLRIEMKLIQKGKPFKLEQIRDEFYIKIGKEKDQTSLTMEEAFKKYLDANKLEWSANSLKKITGTLNHLREFEILHGPINLSQFDYSIWDSFRDDYCIVEKQFSNNTSNTYLKNFKQFLKFCKKINCMKVDIDFDELKYLDEIEVYNIALKIDEVQKIASLNLQDKPHLDRVRDLFILEILTGQRFSDIPKLLDKKNLHETYIDIYQEKTNDRVKIPLHPELKQHLKELFRKYPDGLPSITNQKFNAYLKDIGKLAKLNQKHTWTTLVGNKKVIKEEIRSNLITSHTGRKTFCTLSLKQKIHHEDIMKVTGHRSYDQFQQYVKIDEQDTNEAFKNLKIKSK